MSATITPGDREFVTTRSIPASPACVFEACRNPAQLAKWWGPNGFRNTFHTFEFKPDGVWNFTMHGPDGRDYPNTCVFREVSPERIIIQHLATVHEFTLTITMTAEGEGTRLTWRQQFTSQSEYDKVSSFVPRCNEENLDRLEVELDRQSLLERELVLTRVIDAPREKVYRCWTEPELIVQWFTPAPYITTHAELDVRPGGVNNVTMRAPDGTEMVNRGIYLEVVRNERLVCTDAFISAWEPSSKPFIVIDLTFEELDGKTKYTARVLHWTVADREAHEKMGFYQGWGLATDQLEALAKKI